MGYYLKLIRLSAEETWDKGVYLLFDIHNFVQFITAWIVLVLLLLVVAPLYVAVVVIGYPVHISKLAYDKWKPKNK